MIWKENKSVIDWLQGLEGKTRNNYVTYFPKFLQFVNKSPDEILRERMKDLASRDPKTKFRYEQTVLAFQDHLKTEGKKAYTLHDYLKTVMSFFARNRVPLVFRKGEIESGKPSRHQWIPTNAQVRMVYGIASLRDKIGLLLAYQSGLSPVDIEELDIDKMPLYNEIGVIETIEHRYFEVYRSKSNQLTQTCLSNEILHDIDLYLKSRGSPKTGPLLISHKGDRLKGEDLNTSLRETAKTALGEKFAFKITLLRKSYQNALDNTPTISKNYSETLMGHSLGVTAHYSKPSEQEIKTAYDQVFPRLSIN
jgi:site-specific recombinase XerD